jgi:hypothetical protein
MVLLSLRRLLCHGTCRKRGASVTGGGGNRFYFFNARVLFHNHPPSANPPRTSAVPLLLLGCRGPLSAGSHPRRATEAVVVGPDPHIQQFVQRPDIKDGHAAADAVAELLIEVTVIDLGQWRWRGREREEKEKKTMRKQVAKFDAPQKIPVIRSQSMCMVPSLHQLSYLPVPSHRDHVKTH